MTGPKNAATRAVPRRCTANSAIRMTIGERHDVVLERRRHELETFDRRQHRDRRRDHGVAEEHRGADHAEHQHERRAPAERARRERRERERAALAVVVGAQQDQHVFERDDDDQRPQDHRQHAEHDLARDRPGSGGRHHRLAERVERARADVAIDDADAAERQRPEARRRNAARRPAGAQPARRGFACDVSSWIGGRPDRRRTQQEARLISPAAARIQHAPADAIVARNAIRSGQI